MSWLDCSTAQAAEGGAASSGELLGIRAEASYSYDNNVGRASSASDRLADRSYNINASKSLSMSLSGSERVVLSGFLGGESFQTYTGLGRAYAGFQADYKYRSSGEFGVPMWTVFARSSVDRYESTLRSGSRYAGGVSVRKTLTDRISIFSSLSGNLRRGNSAVFNTRDYGLKANLDYSFGSSGTLYLSGEYRRGDIVSSGNPTLQVVDIASVFIKDDVFTSPQFFSYRFKAKTTLALLGYNIPFGSRDSLDASCRWAKSIATAKLIYAASPTYSDRECSLAYLMTF